MKRQVLYMEWLGGTYTVTFDPEKKVNPYMIHFCFTVDGKNHASFVDEYADFYSCLCDLNNHIGPGAVHTA